MKVIGIIPSRYNSTRFPGKPLVYIKGKTMIRRVYEQAKKALLLTDVIVATDDERIFREVQGFGGHVVMTSGLHKNGTERCAEVTANSGADVVINIQGDEPFIEAAQIDSLVSCFQMPDTQIATLIKKHVLDDELRNPARVKVTVNKQLQALYFSRALIPFLHVATDVMPTYYKHIGIYGYRKNVLSEIVKLAPTPLEIAESLEQLRWLENGYCIQCSVTEHDSFSVDTPEDLKQFVY